ncbi:MAG TPA: polymer-forming cytoskeletal protein, partial [Ramlibacter sp.]
MAHSSRTARAAAHVVFVASLAFAGAAHAARNVDTDAVIIDTDNNLVLAGGRVSPGKPVPENFVGFGGSVIIDQPVGGNAVAAGGTVDVRAPVGGRVRVAGGTVHVDSAVTGDLVAAGGEVRIGKSATIGGRARVMAGDVVVDGIVNGDLRADGGSVTINGEVHGDVRAYSDEVVLGPTAKITGRLSYVSASITRADGAVVGGAVQHLDDLGSARDEVRDRVASTTGAGARIIGAIVTYLALLACGAVFLAAAPIFSVEAPERLRTSPGQSIGVGLLTIVGVPILTVLFMITLIGI